MQVKDCPVVNLGGTCEHQLPEPLQWDEHTSVCDLTACPKTICGRCYEVLDEVFPANCQEKPELLLGQPIGQYHCRDCGAMVIAGVPHPPLCKACLDRTHPAFDVPISGQQERSK